MVRALESDTMKVTANIRSVLMALIVSLTCLHGQSSLFGQGIEYVKANYTKFEFRIPMRDGKRLFTAVYVPKDASKTYPIMLLRTPYSLKPYGVDQYRTDLGPSPLFGKSGYIFAYQDVRGRHRSEGEWVNMRPFLTAPSDGTDESTDTWDTIEWLVKNLSLNNGKVGLSGISYPGFYTDAGMINAHPALVACSPQAPIVDWFIGDDWHHNGAFQLSHLVGFIDTVGYPWNDPNQKVDTPEIDSPDGYDFLLKLGTLTNIGARYKKSDLPYWKELMAHGTYDDYWKARNVRPHLKNIRPAVLTVGGWFDAENLFGAVETYRNVETNSVGTKNFLVMGPWSHGGWSRGDGETLGDLRFNSKTGLHFREQIEFPFFEQMLKGEGKPNHPEAWVFETGTNVWRKYENWPPKSAVRKSLYLHAGGKIANEPPTETDAASAFDEYPSDPARPVPYVEKIVKRMPGDYMTADQRHASRRPDVLVYTSDVLESDQVISGPIEVELNVSTSGTDSDWVVKLIDVYPNDFPDPTENPTGVKMGGYQQLVRGDLFRGRFRKSFEKPEAFTPNRPDVVKFTMPDVCHAFRPGHRIMIQIHSSWFPLFDRNPQTFVDIATAKDSDFQKANQRVYRTSSMASRITFPWLATPAEVASPSTAK